MPAPASSRARSSTTRASSVTDWTGRAIGGARPVDSRSISVIGVSIELWAHRIGSEAVRAAKIRRHLANSVPQISRPPQKKFVVREVFDLTRLTRLARLLSPPERRFWQRSFESTQQ